MPTLKRFAIVIILVLTNAPAGFPQEGPVKFQLQFTKNVSESPFTGRVFVIASKQSIQNGPLKQSWFKPEPFFAQDVKNWQPGEPLTFQPQYHFPQSLEKLAAGKYYLQAVMDLDRGGQNALTAPGNAYNKPRQPGWNIAIRN